MEDENPAEPSWTQPTKQELRELVLLKLIDARGREQVAAMSQKAMRTALEALDPDLFTKIGNESFRRFWKSCV